MICRSLKIDDLLTVLNNPINQHFPQYLTIHKTPHTHIKIISQISNW